MWVVVYFFVGKVFFFFFVWVGFVFRVCIIRVFLSLKKKCLLVVVVFFHPPLCVD